MQMHTTMTTAIGEVIIEQLSPLSYTQRCNIVSWAVTRYSFQLNLNQIGKSKKKRRQLLTFALNTAGRK